MGISMSLRLYSLNETTLLRCLIDCVLRRDVVIVSIRPFIARCRRPIERFAAWATSRGRGRGRDAVMLAPALAPYARWSRQLYFREAFSRIEPWMDRRFCLDDRGPCDASLHDAFKALTCNVIYDQVFDVYAVDFIRRANPSVELCGVGLPTDTIDMYRGTFDGQALTPKRRWPIARSAINLGIGIAAVLWTGCAIAARLKSSGSSDPVFCILDILGNRIERHVSDEIADGGPVVLMDRRPKGACGEWDTDTYEHCSWGDGFFGWRDGLEAFAQAVRDVSALWRRNRTIHPSHFLAAVTLPLKRLKWRALFNCYRVKHYLGRDEYNPEHILRRGELHRIGAISHGWSGGIYTAYARLSPNARYVNFDHYYCVAIGLFKPFIERWPRDMNMHSTGSFGFPRARMESSQSESGAILVAMRVAFAEPEYLRMVQMLARSFPSHRILLQIKRVGFLRDDERVDIVNTLERSANNVLSTEKPIYDLLADASCMISDISTIVAESIDLGIPTYVADVLDQDYCVYREFPGLCITSAEDLVDAVGTVLRDPKSYPFEDYRRRLNRGTDVGYDVLRRQMGLPERAPSRP